MLAVGVGGGGPREISRIDQKEDGCDPIAQSVDQPGHVDLDGNP